MQTIKQRQIATQMAYEPFNTRRFIRLLGCSLLFITAFIFVLAWDPHPAIGFALTGLFFILFAVCSISRIDQSERDRAMMAEVAQRTAGFRLHIEKIKAAHNTQQLDDVMMEISASSEKEEFQRTLEWMVEGQRNRLRFDNLVNRVALADSEEEQARLIDELKAFEREFKDELTRNKH